MSLFFEQAETTIVGTFGEICRMPILNIAPMCDDAFLRALPVAYARYETDTRTQFIIDYNYDLTAPAEACDGMTADHEIQDCELYLPNQTFSAIEGESRRYDEDMVRFCRPRKITGGVSIFDANGRLKDGLPLAETFLAYRVAEMKQIVMRFLKTRYMTGVSSTSMEPNGILTQLTNGWDGPGAGNCASYRAFVYDWAAATTGAALANPDATITAANDTITMYGQVFTGFTGFNFVELLRKMLLRIRDYTLAGHRIDSMFLATGRGQSECILEAAACLQPCNGCTPLSDPGQRDRLAEFLRTRVFYLYPYVDVPIYVYESPSLGNNVIFGPWQVDGEYTIQVVFRAQAENLMDINEVSPNDGWWRTGLPGTDAATDLLLPDISPAEFEARTFMYIVDRDKLCIQPIISFEWSVPVFAQHAMVLFQNVDCTTLVPPACEETPSVAVSSCANGAGGDRLDMTMASDPTCGITADDRVRVDFTDGTVLFGVVISYNAGSNVLVVEFAAAIVCTTYGQPLTVTCVESGS